MLLGNMSFRKLSRSIAASDLLADFCGVRTLEGIHGVSKSVLERLLLAERLVVEPPEVTG
jgi:hypothetical protein